MAKLYEIVIFTASLSKYANPLINKLGIKRNIDFRLFRQHCTFHQGMYIKDMEWLGRNLEDIIILDNSPISYLFQPDNGMPIKNWYDDRQDTELLDYIHILEKLATCDDVTKYLPQIHGFQNNIDFMRAR